MVLTDSANAEVKYKIELQIKKIEVFQGVVVPIEEKKEEIKKVIKKEIPKHDD